MAETTYRLSIAEALEEFRPEIEHACGFLDACYHLRRDPGGDRILHYGPGAPPEAVSIPAVLFPAGVRVAGDGIYPRHDALARMAEQGEGGLRPASKRDAQNFRYDALGLIFFLLSRIEERGHPWRDRYQRFPVGAALFQPKDGRLYPLADQAGHEIAAALTGESEPRLRTEYAVCLTHDVDILKGFHRPIEPLRHALGDILKRGNPVAALQRLKRGYFSQEPWISFRELMRLAERHGIASRFYFMGPSNDPTDSPYALHMADLLRRLTAEVRMRGHVVGFHPGFHTATDAAEWRRQRDGLEAVIGAPVREGRQHVLRYDAAVTPRIWSDAGMTMDCTLAYPEAVGFRSGTCRPHHAYDLVVRQTLPLRQISTAVMEFGLFGGKYRSLSPEAALADSKWAVDMCRQYGGTFTLLFHTGQMQRDLWSWLRPTMDHAAPR